MPEYDVTFVDRKSGRVVHDRIMAKDDEDARRKSIRPGWQTGSIEAAPADAVDQAPADAVEPTDRMFTEDDWTRLYRTIRRGVLVGTLIYTAIVVAVGLGVWTIIAMMDA